MNQYTVLALLTKAGSKWETIHTSFSLTTAEEEYTKATKNKKWKEVKLIDPNGVVLRSVLINAEGKVQKTEQLTLF